MNVKTFKLYIFRSETLISEPKRLIYPFMHRLLKDQLTFCAQSEINNNLMKS